MSQRIDAIMQNMRRSDLATVREHLEKMEKAILDPNEDVSVQASFFLEDFEKMFIKCANVSDKKKPET